MPGRYRGMGWGALDTPVPSVDPPMPTTEIFENPNMCRVSNYLLIVRDVIFQCLEEEVICKDLGGWGGGGGWEGGGGIASDLVVLCLNY